MNEQLAAIKARREAVTPGVVSGPVYSQTKADATDKANWLLMREELNAANADIDTLLAEVERLHRLFEDLTPGGSEFHDSPDNCAAWARNRVGTTSKIAKERNELAAHVAALTAERDALAQQLQQSQSQLARLEPLQEQEEYRQECQQAMYDYMDWH